MAWLTWRSHQTVLSADLLLAHCLELLAKGSLSNNTLPIIIMAAWQHSSSVHRMPSVVSTPTAAARGVGVKQKLQAATANRHRVDFQSMVEQGQDVPGSTPSPTSTSTSTGSGGDRKSDTTDISTSPNARNKKGISKHGSCGDGSSVSRDGVPRRLILTQGHNDIHYYHHHHHHHHHHHRTPTSFKESKRALQENDSMCYLDGPQVYTCANCRTHLTSHDDIISKSFHGRNGM